MFSASSAQLKRDIRPLGAGAAGVLSLRPVSYRYKPQYAEGANSTQYGLIAEQVARQLPALVQHGPGRKASGVYYQELSVLLLAELQAQQRQLHQQAQASQHQQRELDQLAQQIRALR